jgi:hypothetical protein
MYYKEMIKPLLINGELIRCNKYKCYDHKYKRWSTYIDLKVIFNILKIEYKINKKEILINFSPENDIKIDFNNKDDMILYDHNINKNYISKLPFGKMIFLVNKKYYIDIGIIRYIINGSIKETNKKVNLFTHDYERKDIPKDLIECYKYFDKKLDKETKLRLKSGDYFKEHFGLGLWIRNNWIRPGHNRIGEYFIDKWWIHIDSISNMILEGYYHYLNCRIKTFEDLDTLTKLIKNKTRGHCT